MFRNWNIMRVLRLATGIMLMAQGIRSHDWAMATIGGMFSLAPLLNVGCCTGNRCTTSCTGRPAAATKDISHKEEVH